MQQRETNWAGNHIYRAQQLLRPSSMQELSGVIGAAQQVRALGSRHSFTDLADTAGSLVSLAGMPADVEIDTDQHVVRVRRESPTRTWPPSCTVPDGR